MNEKLTNEEGQELSDKSNAFEEKYGSDMFFKTVFSALNRFLVEKGIATERDIRDYFTQEMEIQDKALKLMQKEDLQLMKPPKKQYGGTF